MNRTALAFGVFIVIVRIGRCSFWYGSSQKVRVILLRKILKCIALIIIKHSTVILFVKKRVKSVSHCTHSLPFDCSCIYPNFHRSWYKSIVYSSSVILTERFEMLHMVKSRCSLRTDKRSVIVNY